MTEQVLNVRYPETHPVLDELGRRLRGESPQMKLALSFEGGGAASVISSGMGQSLQTLGIGPEHFDAVFGISGGAYNATYFMSQQMDDCTAGYWEDMGKALVDFKRLSPFSDRPMIDMEHMLTGIVERKPVHFKQVFQHGKLRPVAMDFRTQKAYAFTPASNLSNLLMQLRATAAVPGVGDKPVKIDGSEYVDGGFVEKIPFDTVFKLKFDAILVLSSNSLNTREPSALKALGERALRRTIRQFYYPFLAEGYVPDSDKVNETKQRMRNMTEHPTDGPYAFVISPSVFSSKVPVFEMNPDMLKAAAAEGNAAVQNALRPLSNLR